MWKNKLLSRDNSVYMKKFKDPINRRKFHERNRHKTSHEFPLHSPTKSLPRKGDLTKAKAVAKYSLYRKNSYDLTSHIESPTKSKKRKNEPRKDGFKSSFQKNSNQNILRRDDRTKRGGKRVKKTSKFQEKANIGSEEQVENRRLDSKSTPPRSSPTKEQSDIFFRAETGDSGDLKGKKIIKLLNNTSSEDQGRYPRRGKKTFGLEHLKSDVRLERPHKVEFAKFQKRGKFPKFQVQEEEKKQIFTKRITRNRNDSSSVSSLLSWEDRQ